MARQKPGFFSLHIPRTEAPLLQGVRSESGEVADAASVGVNTRGKGGARPRSGAGCVNHAKTSRAPRVTRRHPARSASCQTIVEIPAAAQYQANQWRRRWLMSRISQRSDRTPTKNDTTAPTASASGSAPSA